MANTGRFFPVQPLHIGPTGSIASLNVTTLGFDGTPASGGGGPFSGQLGMVIEDSGKVYRLVQHTSSPDSVATAAGFVAYWKTRASFIVTSDEEDTEAGVNGVAGAYLGVVTAGNYCFVQIGGLQAVNTDTTCAAGTALMGSTTDGALSAATTNTLGNQVIFAISWGTNSTTSANVYWLLGTLI